MKKYIVVLLFSISALYSQQWQQINSPTTNISKIIFTDKSHGFLLGKYDSIYFTSDMGYTWQLRYATGKQEYKSLNFTDSRHGYVIDSYKSIKRTADGGRSWEISKIELGTNDRLSDFYFLNGKTGWVVGGDLSSWYNHGFIYSTIDSGLTWKKINRDTTLSGLKSIYFLNKLEGWAVGPFMHEDNYDSGRFYYTSDGGINWIDLYGYFAYYSSGPLSSVKFANNKFGFISGDNRRIFKTTDGGNLFELIKYGGPSYSNSRIYSLEVFDINNISFADDCSVMKSVNGGKSWKCDTLVKPISYISNIFYLCYLSRDTGWAYTYEGQIFRYLKGAVSTGNYRDQNKNYLYNCYPNPANPNTTIEYYIDLPGKVILKIYDALGREMETPVNTIQKSGKYILNLDFKKYSSGVYFYRIFSNNWSETKKMMILR
jgi:photosystem II stability/assembly factor-like uncharacterized protein